MVKNLSVVFRTSPADTQLSLNARNTNENGIAEVTLKGTVLGGGNNGELHHTTGRGGKLYP
ncbi:hypothetical protein DM462_15155 [Escherichia coli]|uniref:hypothetical protein n=1 Tax=Escherichia coli TaxID=562 RepID=UPI000D9B83DB|nr:hypothetical protein DM462_15155 [Escherichia coli]